MQVDLPHQQAYVIVAAASYDRAAMLNVLAQAGYRGTVLKEEPIDNRLSMNH